MKKDVKSATGGEKNVIICTLKGVAAALIISAVLLPVFAGVCMAIEISEAFMKGGCLVIMLLSVLAGSVYGVGQYKSRGLIVGGVTGILYILFMLLAASVLNGGIVFGRISLSVISFAFIAGAIGGIVKLNLKPKRR